MVHLHRSARLRYSITQRTYQIDGRTLGVRYGENFNPHLERQFLADCVEKVDPARLPMH